MGDAADTLPYNVDEALPYVDTVSATPTPVDPNRPKRFAELVDRSTDKTLALGEVPKDDKAKRGQTKTIVYFCLYVMLCVGNLPKISQVTCFK